MSKGNQDVAIKEMFLESVNFPMGLFIGLELLAMDSEVISYFGPI